MASLKRMNVEDLKNAALNAGFSDEDIKGLSKLELIALIEESDKDGDTEETAGEVITNVDKFKGDIIHVYEKSDGGAPTHVRSYSEEVHGEDFLESAKSFVGKKAAYFLMG